ncbi:MAG: TonB-dependent receptor [Haemophilus parainfluenzae]|nr:TonB-dependent receptor [Haemophilus parainfluenzae]
MLFSDYETQSLGNEAYHQLADEIGDKAYDLDQIEDPAERKRAQDRVYEIFHNKVKEYMKNPKFKNIDGIFNTQPAQVQFARDNHMGITFSNVTELSPKLRFSIMTNYRRETLDSTNVYELWDKYQLTAFNQYDTDDKTEGGNLTCAEGDLHGICRVSNSARSGNRKGNRNEFNAGFKFEYSPTDWLLLTAGMKYTHYKSKDRGLQEKIANLKQEEVLTESRIPFIVKKLKQVSPELTQNYLNYERKSKLFSKLYNEFEELYPKPDYDSPEFEQWVNNQSNYIYAHGYTESTEEENEAYAILGQNDAQWDESATQTIYWERDEYGNFSVEHFPLKDGRITKEMLEKKVIHPQTGKEDYLYDIDADFSGSPEKTPITKEQWEKMKKAERKDHAWAPSFSATAFLSDNARIYVRYDETKRMPSIFEDTIGYSIDILTPLYKRKPEHSKNIEVGYVHDLRGFFPSLRRADIRLNWYKNTTKNIFDRDINYEMKQFDRRILEGVELSARYDQGRIFGDIGISYNIKNKFCDKSSAIRDVGLVVMKTAT